MNTKENLLGKSTFPFQFSFLLEVCHGVLVPVVGKLVPEKILDDAKVVAKVVDNGTADATLLLLSEVT